jgi:hypothetical protein
LPLSKQVQEPPTDQGEPKRFGVQSRYCIHNRAKRRSRLATELNRNAFQVHHFHSGRRGGFHTDYAKALSLPRGEANRWCLA